MKEENTDNFIDWKHLIAVQNEFIKHSFSDAPLEDVLSKLTDHLDELNKDHAVSILIMTDDGLVPIAGTRFPEVWREFITPLPIGNNIGSCGTAGYLKKPVIVENVLDDIRWADFREYQPVHGYMACWSQPILDNDDNLLATFAIYFRDPRRPSDDELDMFEMLANTVSIIFERKNNEAILNQAKDAADAANRAKSAFLANMSHELRTPLNAILGFAQTMQRSPNVTQEHQRQIQTIYKGGQYLLTLISDILDLAKVEAGRIELFPEPLGLETFLRETVDMFRFRADEKGIAFNYQANAPLPHSIHIDPKRLRQVIINLLGNAVKFTDQGQVDLSVAYQNDQLLITVKDTGPGIEPEQHEEIFKPFSQTGNKLQKLQGTGLGLSISRKIVELMDGSIALDSNLGEGACFQVSIPVKADFELSPKEQNTLEQRDIIGYRNLQAEAPLRIMIVDDIADNREVLRLMLEELSFETREADSGEACLQLVQSWQPDLVLMDLRMPRQGGLETVQKQHIFEKMENIPVIMVSASVYVEDKENASAAGCVGFLLKPINRETLLKSLQKNLPLEWEYTELVESPKLNNPNKSLSDTQKAALLRIVRSGDIRSAMDYLEQMIQTPDCPEQAHELLKFAKKFQLKEIRRRLEPCLSE